MSSSNTSLPPEEETPGKACPIIDLNRQVRIAAGSLVLISVGLGWFVHRGFYALAAFVGAGLVFAGVTNICGLCHLLALLPWNKPKKSS